MLELDGDFAPHLVEVLLSFAGAESTTAALQSADRFAGMAVGLAAPDFSDGTIQLVQVEAR